jgi:hypothetical protein
MFKRSITRWVTVSILVAAGFRVGVAGAQDGSREGSSDAELMSEQRANLSGPEQITQAGRIIDTITGMRRRVSDMLDRARQERDIIKVTCLNDKLTQLDVTIRSANDHRELLQTAVSINNDGQRQHEFALLTIFRQRGDALESEARQCIGEEAGGFGDGTVVTMRVDPNIATEDTTLYPVDQYAPERPLVASPVR